MTPGASFMFSGFFEATVISKLVNSDKDISHTTELNEISILFSKIDHDN